MARMDIGITGAGANPGKIMFYLGMLFVILGALIGGGGLLAALGTHELGAVLLERHLGHEGSMAVLPSMSTSIVWEAPS